MGFFPFLGFLEENPYENTYDYIFGGETNSVSKSADWIISYPDPEDFPDEPHDNDEDFVQPDMIEKNIGSTYFLNTEKRMTIDREKVMEDSPEITRRGLSLNYKRDGQSLYPADGELCLPAEFFIRNTSAEEMVYIDIDYEYNEEEAVEYLQSLRPRDDDEEEATFDEYKFLAIPAAVALIGGYLAYKNKKGG